MYLLRKALVLFTALWQAAMKSVASKKFTKDSQDGSGIKHYDVILNSYMRGGSTLVGLVLGFRSDTFYMYEPLWKVSRWTYWRGNSTVCRLDRPECRQLDPEMSIDKPFANNKNTDSPGGSLAMAKKILFKIYDCLFNDFERTVVEDNLTARLGGPSWESVKSCTKTTSRQKTCIHKYAPIQCKKSRHKVSKVLRLTLDNLEDFLQNRDNLKVFHLFRDPRAILNSRIETNWYPADSKPEILNNSRSLCDKMMYDFKTGSNMMQKYIHKLKFIFYEDFSENPLEKAKAMYRYLGMSLGTANYQRVLQASIFNTNQAQSERQKNTAFWWRMSMDWETVQEIDAICGDVMRALGYVTFNSEAELRNLTKPSFVISNNYSLIPKEQVRLTL